MTFTLFIIYYDFHTVNNIYENNVCCLISLVNPGHQCLMYKVLVWKNFKYSLFFFKTYIQTVNVLLL